MANKVKLVCIGVITGAHGIKGAVKIKSFTENPVDIANYSPLYGSNGATKYNIKILSESGGALISEVAGVSSRNDAEMLGNTELFIYRDMLPSTEENEFYYDDLIGMEVRLSSNNKPIGIVTGIYNFGAGDVLTIKLNDTDKDELIVFNKENVPEVNISNRYITVKFPETEFAPDKGGE